MDSVMIFWIVVGVIIFSLGFEPVREFFSGIFGGIVGCGCSCGCLVVIGIFLAPSIITAIINILAKIAPTAIRIFCETFPDKCPL